MTSDAEARQTSLAQAQQAKTAVEAELQTLKTTLQQIRDEDSRDRALLEQEETWIAICHDACSPTLCLQLREAKLASSAQAETIRNLESKVKSLMAEVETARDNFEILRIMCERSSFVSATAAQAEREALLRARADFESVSAEAEALKASRASILQDLQAMRTEAKVKSTHTDALEAQVKELKAEREEIEIRVYRLEAILGSRSNRGQEQADDEHAMVLG